MWFLREVLHLSEVAATAVNFVFRKSVHIVAYGALALSAYRVAWGQGATPRRSACAAYSWAVPHAVLDEFSQSRVATRSGSPWDVLLDIAGMTAFVLLFGRVKQEPNQE